MSKIRSIAIELVKYIAYEFAVQTMSWGEPIPEFETRYPNILESCIVTPFQKFDKKYLYKGLIGKASIMFYLMIKNHPFKNGNKRMAMTTLLMFLFLNHKWIKSDPAGLYNFARWVAESPSEARKEVVEYIQKFINKRLEEAK